MTALEKITNFRELWAVVIPHLPPPPPADIARWFSFPANAVEQSIVRTARRFAREKIREDFNPVEAYRYASSVARSITSQATPAPPALKEAQ